MGKNRALISGIDKGPDAIATQRAFRSLERAINGFGAEVKTSQVTADQVALAAGPTWTSGVGTPEGTVVAPIGSLYTRLDGGTGTTLYIKESGTGNTGWVAK